MRLPRPGAAYPAGERDLDCRIPRNAVLYALAPPRTDKRGRPRTKGERPGTADDLAAAEAWDTITVTAYGRQETRHVAEITCLWYRTWHTRAARLILSRDERTVRSPCSRTPRSSSGTPATGTTRPDAKDRRATQPWYKTKTRPAFEDMLIKLRQTMIAARFPPTPLATPHPSKSAPPRSPGNRRRTTTNLQVVSY